MSRDKAAAQSGNEFIDLWLEEIWFIWSTPVADDLTLGVEKELLEVPRHVSSLKVRFVSQPFVNWTLSLIKY